MKTVIYTPYDCLIKVGDNSQTIDQNESLVLEEYEKKIDIYPINKNSRYSFTVDFDNSPSPFYRVIEREGQRLVFLIDGLISQNIDIFSIEAISEREIESPDDDCNNNIDNNQIIKNNSINHMTEPN